VIIVAGTFDLDPSRRDAMLEAVLPVVRATQQEPGCIDYVMMADPTVPGRVRLFERWVDAGSLDAHFQGPNIANARAARAPYDAKAEIWRYDVPGEGTRIA
jgi:quinol monooxygenase YgiN